ncbi:MAG: hypothetical protein K2L83_02010, partial [Muribaculaceae bacterium]|nr:hypothetical protein [Muribaculaceae bacterium]
HGYKPQAPEGADRAKNGGIFMVMESRIGQKTVDSESPEGADRAKNGGIGEEAKKAIFIENGLKRQEASKKGKKS